MVNTPFFLLEIGVNAFVYLDVKDAIAKAKARFDAVVAMGPNRMTSGSDDTCLILWNPDLPKPLIGMREPDVM